MYAEFSGGGVRPNDVRNADESKRFWGNNWNVGKGHNREAEWLKDIKNELGYDNLLQERLVIGVGKVTKQCRKMSNWKTPGKNGAFRVIVLRALTIFMNGFLFRLTRS